MNLFNKQKQTSSEKLLDLQKQSIDILSVFEDTAVQLEQVVESIINEQDNIDAEITKLKAAKADANLVRNRTKKAAEKIRDIIS